MTDQEPIIDLQRIAGGLEELALRLANDNRTPKGWMPYEWAFIRGLASGAILECRDSIAERLKMP